MIRIVVNKEFEVYIDPETSITFNFNSPLFNYKQIEGDYTFTFTIPAIPENKAYFGLLHKIENTVNSIPIYPIELYINNVGPLVGTMEVDGDITATEYEATIFLGRGDFQYLTKDKKLNTIDLGGVQALNSFNDLKTITNQQYPITKFQVFPIYNDQYFKDIFSTDGGADGKPIYVGDISPWMNEFILAEDWADAKFNYLDNAMCLFPYLTYVLEKCFIDYGYTIKQNIFNEIEELKTLVIYNTFGNNLLSKGVVNQYNYELLIDDGVDAGNGFKLNIGNNTLEFTAVDRWEGGYLYNEFPTRSTTNQILEPIEQWIGTLSTVFGENPLIKLYFDVSAKIVDYIIVGIIFNSKNAGDEYQTTLTDNTCESFTWNETSIPVVSDYYLMYKQTYDLVNHLPNITIQEFLQALKNIFNIEYIIDKQSVSIVKVDDLINSKNIEEYSQNCEDVYMLNFQKEKGATFKQTPDSTDEYYIVKDFNGVTFGADVDTYTNLLTIPVIINEVRLVANKIYYIGTLKDFNGTPTWEIYQYAYRDYTYLGGELPINTIISSLRSDLKQTFTNNAGTELIKAPFTGQLGKLNLFGSTMSNNEFSLRLLFYRGLKENIFTGNLYPYANEDELNQYFNPVYNYSLYWDGDNGLINKFWINTLYFLTNRKLLTYQKQLNAVDIINQDFFTKKRVFNNTVFNKSIQVTVTGDIIQPAKIEAWTV